MALSQREGVRIRFGAPKPSGIRSMGAADFVQGGLSEQILGGKKGAGPHSQVKPRRIGVNLAPARFLAPCGYLVRRPGSVRLPVTDCPFRLDDAHRHDRVSNMIGVLIKIDFA